MGGWSCSWDKQFNAIQCLLSGLCSTPVYVLLVHYSAVPHKTLCSGVLHVLRGGRSSMMGIYNSIQCNAEPFG